eukprot:7157828-Prymnesium_polylepis.1
MHSGIRCGASMRSNGCRVREASVHTAGTIRGARLGAQHRAREVLLIARPPSGVSSGRVRVSCDVRTPGTAVLCVSVCGAVSVIVLPTSRFGVTSLMMAKPTGKAVFRA